MDDPAIIPQDVWEQNREGIERSLVQGACADAKHDFKSRLGHGRGIQAAKLTIGDVLLGLPERFREEYTMLAAKSEVALLQELFNSAGASSFNTINELIDLLSAEPEPAAAGAAAPMAEEEAENSTPELMIPIHGVKVTRYTAKLLVSKAKQGAGGVPIARSYNVNQFYDEIYIKEYKNFFGLGDAEPLNLVIDAQIVGINHLFSLARREADETLIVNSIMNREVINDPAPKTYNLANFARPGAVRYNIIYDEYPKDIVYSRFDNEAPDQYMRNMFYSALDISLSRLERVENTLPKIKMEMTSDTKYIYQTDNPHLTNGIESCWKTIEELFSLGKKGKHPERHIKCSAMFQCKRSGDWLQALSCLDSNRPYSMPLNGKMILVTHDRILLWYALFMGIHVVFTCLKSDSGTADDYSEQVSGSIFQKGVGPEKIMLYFNPGDENPVTKLQRYRTIVSSMDLAASFTEYKNKYNRWIREIVDSIMGQIVDKDREILAEANGRDRNYMARSAIKIKEILQLYWKLVSISYEAIDVPSKPANVQAATIEILDKFLSDCDNFKRIMEKIKHKEDIILLSENFLLNTVYTNITHPYTDILKIRSSSEERLNISRYVSHIQFRLTPRILDRLIESLKVYSRNAKLKFFLGGPRFEVNWAIDAMINLFERHDERYIYTSICDYLRDSADRTARVAAAGGGGGGGAEAAAPPPAAAPQAAAAAAPQAAAAAAPQAAAAAAAPQAAAAEAAAEAAAAEAAAAAAAEEGKIIINPDHEEGDESEEEYARLLKQEETNSFGYANGDISAQRVSQRDRELQGSSPGSTARLAEKRKKRLYTIISPVFCRIFLTSVNAARLHSGGGKHIYFYPLFLNYLYTLMNAIVGFDSGGVTDYIFYEKLASIIISCIKPVNNDYEELLSVVYSILPGDDWELDASIIPSKPLKQCIKHVANDMALQSLDLREGDIPNVSSKETFLLESKDVLKKLTHLNDNLSKMKFSQRKRRLIMTLGDLINTLKGPHNVQHINPGFLKLATGHNVSSRGKLHHSHGHKGISSKVGGNKTRYNKRKIYKGRKGSPRRRTLRKTRKHR